MKSKYVLIGSIVLIVLTLSVNVNAKEQIMVFCGAAFNQPMEEIIKAFTAKTQEVDVNVTYGGVGTLLSQIMLTKRGDVLVVPSSYTLEQAKSKGLLAPIPVASFAYVVPAINVQKGNPKGIANLKDLTRPSLRVAIANPEIVFTGMLAAELVDKSLSPDERRLFRKNLVTYPEDFNKLATVLVLKNVDAIVGLHNLSQWYPDKVDTIKLRVDQIQRIGTGQVSVLSHSKVIPLAEKFKNFMTSTESNEIFAKYHYFATPQDAFAWIGAVKPIGGERPATDWFKN
jgi:molybdate transport system substrate-binding protein